MKWTYIPETNSFSSEEGKKTVPIEEIGLYLDKLDTFFRELWKATGRLYDAPDMVESAEYACLALKEAEQLIEAAYTHFSKKEEEE